ncbi:MAG: 30S ribosomal protein S11 [Elusimicrobia bacterium]|nr:30S ribosomal protein S11 [Elusimicrobiota bacterium]
MEEKKQDNKEKKAAAKPTEAAASEAKTAAKGKPADKPVKKKKVQRDVSFARAYIQCSFNNTIVSITDDHGGVISWASAGSSGFKGTKKGTPFAAQVTAEKAANKAKEMGVRQVMVFVSGPGSGRETAIRALQTVGFTVSLIRDVTPIPHNGCRPPKPRRV